MNDCSGPLKRRIAYLAHAFPLEEEHYFGEEIEVLRSLNVEVLICACLRSRKFRQLPHLKSLVEETVYLDQLSVPTLVRGTVACLRQWPRLKDLYARLLGSGRESAKRRLKGIFHTWMGVCLAEILRDQGVVHIHAHHGYLASWVAMVAARMLDITYSVTLHGSDLLIDRVFLDVKARHSAFCFTISEYNKKFLLQQYPSTDPGKIMVSHLGVDCDRELSCPPLAGADRSTFVILTVGRLAPVKNHSFLVQACAELKRKGVSFLCLIIGDGKERGRLRRMIGDLGLQREVKMLGFVERGFLSHFYRMADLFVLTSKSEGLPLVLMEAMQNRSIVLAPEMTGIPEIVSDRQTGFLFEKGDLDSFVGKVIHIKENLSSLDGMRERARARIVEEFDRGKNMRLFAATLVESIRKSTAVKGA